MDKAWKTYQEQTREFFSSLGLDARTDVTIQGVRTEHDIDVLVQMNNAGFKVTWLIECKLWTSKVKKLHVLALREIVADTGADRGILLAENGVQSGALEAAALTNVHISSLAELRGSTRKEVFGLRLHDLFDRSVECETRYWEIPKGDRIAFGLRPDHGEAFISTIAKIEKIKEILTKAFRGNYPIELDPFDQIIIPGFPLLVADIEVFVGEADKVLTECESQLVDAEARLCLTKKNGI